MVSKSANQKESTKGKIKETCGTTCANLNRGGEQIPEAMPKR